MFTITRIYSDANGESRFEELEIPLNEKGDIGLLSAALETRKMIFREVPPGYDYDFHTAPQRQYIILPDGSIEIETSSGENRVFNGGDILLVEDTEGKGHRTRNLIPKTRKSIFITF